MTGKNKKNQKQKKSKTKKIKSNKNQKYVIIFKQLKQKCLKHTK
jgi:hypothetical protein